MINEYVVVNQLYEDMKKNDYLNKNTIYIDKEFNSDSCMLLTRQLIKLCEQELEKDESLRKHIVIIISSYGGVLDDFYTVKSFMEYYKEKGIIIETINYGKSMSAGAYLLMSGSKGYRKSTRYGSIMVHQIQCGQSYGSMKDMNINNKNIQKNWEVLKDIMRECTNLTEKELEDFTEKNIDFTYTPQEALEKGIIDKLI